MMKRYLTAVLTLLSLLFANTAFAAIAFDTSANVGYNNNTTVNYTYTATGSNLCVVAMIWQDVGTPTSVTYAGSSMSLAIRHTMLYTYSTPGTVSVYVLPNAPSGAQTLSYTGTAQLEALVSSYSGCSGTQPDSFNYASGTTDGGFQFGLPFTTVADNSAAIAWFDASGAGFSLDSSNGTFLRSVSDIDGHLYRSTSNITPAGSFTLNAKTNASGISSEGIGITLAPFVAASASSPPVMKFAWIED